jgi:hypothetical protein
LTICPPPQAAGRKIPQWLTGKKFPPLKPLHFLPARLAEKFFLEKTKNRS